MHLHIPTVKDTPIICAKQPQRLVNPLLFCSRTKSTRLKRFQPVIRLRKRQQHVSLVKAHPQLISAEELASVEAALKKHPRVTNTGQHQE